MKKGKIDLTIPNLLSMTAEAMEELYTWQANLPDSDEFGGLISQDTGLDEPGGAVILAAGGLFVYWAAKRKGLKPASTPEYHLQCADRAIDYLLRVQHSSGLIDLRNCNYDSSPDTAFAVQRLASLVELTGDLAGKDAAYAGVLEKLKRFIRIAAEGIKVGGFHTPNHRWVIVAALTQAHALFPDLEVESVVRQYLAEGIDVDEDGAYTEHSVGVYDAVCNRSLLLYAHLSGDRGVLPYVHRNLTFDMHLVHADGAAETGLSRRQDYGTRRVPFPLVVGYLLYQLFEPQPQFLGMLNFLWDKCDTPGVDELIWLVYALELLGREKPFQIDHGLLPIEEYALLFPKNGVWRLRRGSLSATLFQGQTRLLALCSGKAELASLKISQSYFGVGSFIGEQMISVGRGAKLISSGVQASNRPGYDFPTGAPVDPGTFYTMRATRKYRPLPPAKSSLEVQEIESGICLRYCTQDNWEGVTAQVALDFAPGGVWETGDTAFKPQAGQVIFLKSGYGAMRYGSDILRIGPGSNTHRIWEMRDAEAAPGFVRVIIPFLTPVDATLTITAGKVELGNLLTGGVPLP